MLNHISVGVRDVARAAEFYDAVLGTLGYRRVMDFLPGGVAYGDKYPEFWIQLARGQQELTVGNGAHIAFAAATPEAVAAFHSAAIEKGATDDGAPGPRPDYGPDYYAAFVVDPDGNRLEAVLTLAPAPAKTKKTAAKKSAAKAAKKTAKKTAPKAKPAKAVKAAKAAKPAKAAKVKKAPAKKAAPKKTAAPKKAAKVAKVKTAVKKPAKKNGKTAVKNKAGKKAKKK